MRQPPFSARTAVSLALGLLPLLGACGGATEPPPPKLSAYYTVVAIDGVPLPAPVMLGRYADQPFPGSLTNAAVTLNELYMKWDMSVTTSAGNPYVTILWPNGPVVIGRDSVEIYSRASEVPALAGRFTDTSLVLAPVGGGIRAYEPADLVEAHAWRLRALR